MTNEEFWKPIDMQQQHDEEIEYISELLARNKDGSSIRALYLGQILCARVFYGLNTTNPKTRIVLFIIDQSRFFDFFEVLL